ncbi:MAG: M20/M25/M40 family metallo-hydrolase, partial [Sulfurovum sp.]|nr:M20/M25/M40 family metallo-hydrolase [Sulfurovaceae bacterium]
ADKLLNYISDFAKKNNYIVEIDSTKNILIKRGNPKLCLQAHYDMVCIGKAPKIEIYEEDGWLKAKDSSLGADNGVAIAMMMSLMEDNYELEFLITSDEEVGLIGANALEFELSSSMMLNLDSEDEAEVYIGCAGGEDIVASKPYAKIQDNRNAYEIQVAGLEGGHSGVDIDKDIPNAIKILTSYLKDKKFGLVSITGGERINSIPTQATAIIKSDEILEANNLVKVTKIENSQPILYGADEFISLLACFRNGVHELNAILNIPDRSINLALVSIDNGFCKVETSARAMSNRSLTIITNETIEFFKSYGYDIFRDEKYPSWSPDKNSFTNIVNEAMIKIFGESKMVAIHAGLECGVIAKKYPHIKFASIGPTIEYPHSTRERLKIDSIDKTMEVVKELMKSLS